jgi:hypothetical protein
VVEVLIEEMFRSDRTDREITSEPWSSKQRSKETTKTTLRSERRSALKKSLTGPTLLEMSGNPTYQDLADF